jgi:HYR domain
LHRLLFTIVLALVLIPSASAMHWLQSSDITKEATGPGGANVDYTPDPDTTCDPAPNSLFAIGTTLVTCKNDSDSSPAGSFNVNVVDTTAPAFTSSASGTTGSTSTASATVSYVPPTASDVVDGSVTVNCTPGPGSFPIGTTHVNCTVSDSHNNANSTVFDVVVTDTGDPSISVTAPGPTEATSAGGAVVNYSYTATDNSGVAPLVTCGGHEPGTTFPIGTTSVTCKATDGAGNDTDSSPFNVTVQDTQPPSLSLPANITVEADSTSGKTVTYTATANDTVAGAVPTTCAPPSGSNFGVGTTTVNCSATDGHGHTANGSFTITVTDSSGPVLSGYANKSVEANGPAGSVVNYPAVNAIDALDGPIASVPCAPASGTKFPLGTTPVNCSATDSHGNTGHATFNVTVADTTPPNLIAPVARSVYATTPTGVPKDAAGVREFLSAASASDIVDANPAVTNDSPAFLPVGPNDIDFFARDFSGNVTVKKSTLVVLPEPPAGTPPLPIPPPPRTPADVTNVKVTPLDGAVRIQWSAGGREVMVTRSTSATRSLKAVGDERVVYKGTASSYTDRGLTNGVEYRYVVMAVDAAGNHSAGVAAVVVPRRNLLKSPKDGARLKKAPKLLWALDPEAQYYNAQLLLNGKKILSVWPVRPAYALKKSWKFEGRKYTLKPGVYTWFVWPGYGARSAVEYGDLMGSRTFRIVR